MMNEPAFPGLHPSEDYRFRAACAAMQGLLSNSAILLGTAGFPSSEVCAHDAVLHADALIAELKKEGGR